MQSAHASFVHLRRHERVTFWLLLPSVSVVQALVITFFAVVVPFFKQTHGLQLFQFHVLQLLRLLLWHYFRSMITEKFLAKKGNVKITCVFRGRRKKHVHTACVIDLVVLQWYVP